ncbi:MAG: protein-disulfide reductase DsbD [Rhodanobacter sp.]
MRLPSTCRIVILSLLVLGLQLGMPVLHAQDTDDLLPVTQAFQLSVDAGSPNLLRLHWKIAPDYYLYRGRIQFKGGDGVTLGTAHLPDGVKSHDPYLGDVETYHHDIDASVPYSVAPGTTRLKLAVQYQGCHEVDPKICYPPYTEQLDLPLPTGVSQVLPAATPANTAQAAAASRFMAGSAATSATIPGAPALPAAEAFHLSAIAISPQELLLRWTMPKGYYLYRDRMELSLRDADGRQLASPRWPRATMHDDPQFGQVGVYFDQLELPVMIAGQGSTSSITLVASFQGCQDSGLCYPVMTRAVTVDMNGGGLTESSPVAGVAPELPPAGVTQNPLKTGLGFALLLALVGGLVLNLMPCVLPVLSIKAVGVLASGTNYRSARRHAWFYSAGVVCSFAALGLAILALRAAGHTLGWGSQLQQPLVVGGLALVMLAVGLSMSGVVQFGQGLGNTGNTLATRSGASGDFFTGVLAVVVASPCTAPFMGAALAYAFAAPMLWALLIFLALGVGLALPFLVIGLVPACARMLPRPGRWMETLKQILAFPMYLTAVWLVWVLAKQRGADAVALVLVAMVLLAMTLWWFERSRSRSAASKLLVVVLGICTLAPMYLLAHVPTPSALGPVAAGSIAFSPQKLAALRAANTPVFVDITADWCVTCKANEHTVLNTPAFHDLLKRTGTVYMQGDWTNVNPTISKFLASYNSPGVPLYVVFPADGGPGEQLSTVLSTAMVEKALTMAAAR